jgi:hypothetical protein
MNAEHVGEFCSGVLPFRLPTHELCPPSRIAFVASIYPRERAD